MKHRKENSENFKTKFYCSAVGKAFGERERERETNRSSRFSKLPLQSLKL